MPVVMTAYCDECGEAPATWVGVETGRVLIEGVDRGQDCYLCEEHYPRDGEHQSHNCALVKFYWPSMPEWNDA